MLPFFFKKKFFLFFFKKKMFSFTTMFTTWLVWTLINISISMFGIPANSWIESILFISILVHDFYVMFMPPFKMRLYYWSGKVEQSQNVSSALSSATVCGIVFFIMNVILASRFENRVVIWYIFLGKIAFIISFFI